MNLNYEISRKMAEDCIQIRLTPKMIEYYLNNLGILSPHKEKDYDFIGELLNMINSEY